MIYIIVLVQIILVKCGISAVNKYVYDGNKKCYVIHALQILLYVLSTIPIAGILAVLGICCCTIDDLKFKHWEENKILKYLFSAEQNSKG